MLVHAIQRVCVSMQHCTCVLCTPFTLLHHNVKFLLALFSCSFCWQLMVAPLQKLTPKANATIKDIGSIDSLVQSFGPYITGMFHNLYSTDLACPRSCFNLCLHLQAGVVITNVVILRCCSLGQTACRVQHTNRSWSKRRQPFSVPLPYRYESRR